ncbi:MAG: hypothetical protein O2827_01505 [Verrucomicrobia bacterium]|nr:hypothetical protein [Verrucomicrobiota bacterium]
MFSEKQPYILTNISLIGLLVIGLVLLSACEQQAAESYTIPKEKSTVATTSQSEEPKMQVLPGMQSFADSASGISYQTPDSWTEFPPSSIRKANFKIDNASGTAEVSVTVFPGDVGGTLANINRWRQQISLSPIDQASLKENISPIIISNHQGYFTKLEGNTESILGGILPFHGSTWFIKMQGDILVIEEEVDTFKSFLSSIRIEDNHH